MINVDTNILLHTYELGDMLNNSEELLEYLKYKEKVDQDPEITKLRRKMRKDKELFEEVQRFGHFHPDYQEVVGRIDKTINEINENEHYKRYKQAEDKINNMLQEISRLLGSAISPSIMVPTNELISGDKCSTGNCSACGLKGNCLI